MERVEAVKRIAVILTELQPPQNIETRNALVMAKALAYTGEKVSALKMVNQVLQNPRVDREEMAAATKLKTAIEKDHFAPPQQETLQEQQLHINPALTPEIIDQQKLKTKIITNFQLNLDQR